MLTPNERPNERPVAASPPSPPLSREQSLRCVYSLNQASTEDSFAAQHMPNGAWGGRMGGPSSELMGRELDPDRNPDIAETHHSIQNWATKVVEAPFFAPPPERLLPLLVEQLKRANQEYSNECGGVLHGLDNLLPADATPAPACQTGMDDIDPKWRLLPPAAWFEPPLGKRLPIGHNLLTQALGRAEAAQGQVDADSLIDPSNVWSSPFSVAFISVGFRRLRFSMPGVLGLLEQHRPDILFLGDLGVANHRIGRLKLLLEASVDEEWILFKNICNSRGYPVGLGAMVHVSTAKFITQLEVSCPPDLDQQEWALAVGGRILHLELNRPEAGGRIWFVGLNQHVAANNRVASRELVLLTLAHISTLAKTHGWRLVILGDANAAPVGGRWGYSHNTKTGAADQRMHDWLAQTELCEIRSAPLQPTWKACLLPKKATLDRAWVHPADLPVSSLLVKWAAAQPVFDHAMIMLQLPHTVAGLGFAGACRPLNQTIQAPRCRVNVRKFREPAIRAEWSKLLQHALTNFSGGSVAEQQDDLDPAGTQRATSTVAHGSAAVSNSNVQGCGDSDAGAVADSESGVEVSGVPESGIDGGTDAGATDAPVDMAGGDLGLLNSGNTDGGAGNNKDDMPGSDPKDAEKQTTQDPFQALRYAEMMAAQIAHSLAPRRQRKRGEVCRSFAFSGHRTIFREINLLNAARALVKKIILRSPDILHCAHRDMLWYLKIGRLHGSIARSGHYRPSTLHYSTKWYFGHAANMVLTSWLGQAKTAVDVRWAAVREDIAKAKYINECKAREMLIRSGGMLDHRLLANALGKRQPRPRMWGVAGQVSLGVRFNLCRENPPPLLAYLLTLPETEGVVSAEGTDCTLKIWFRGPRSLGDFLSCWCS